MKSRGHPGIVRGAGEAGDALVLLQHGEHVMHRLAAAERQLDLDRAHQRGSVTPDSSSGRHHLSCPAAFTVYGVERTTSSGWPNCSASCQAVGSGQRTGGGSSFGLPSGAPESIQRTMVLRCDSLRERSFLNSRIPTVRSMCQGGIVWVWTRYDQLQVFPDVVVVSNDISAIDPGRWQT
jgi:hypothetical protein